MKSACATAQDCFEFWTTPHLVFVFCHIFLSCHTLSYSHCSHSELIVVTRGREGGFPQRYAPNSLIAPDGLQICFECGPHSKFLSILAWPVGNGISSRGRHKINLIRQPTISNKKPATRKPSPSSAHPCPPAQVRSNRLCNFRASTGSAGLKGARLRRAISYFGKLMPAEPY